jgi:transcriptional regulator with XRE-family HTH domain
MLAEQCMTIGEKIKAIRQQKGFSQEMLQEKSGIKRNFISLIENNHRGVSYRTLEKMAKALSVTVGEITDYQHNLYPSAEGLTPSASQVAEDTDSGRYLKQCRCEGRYLSIPIIDEKLVRRRLFPIAEDKVKDHALIQNDWIPDPQDLRRYCCLCITNPESALPPLVESGTLVCIDSGQRDPKQLQSKIVAFYDDGGGCSIRRLQIKGKTIIGLPQDSRYSPLVFPASRREQIIGRVIWHMSQL